VCTYTYTHICMHKHKHIYIYIYIYVCAYTHTHTHTHTVECFEGVGCSIQRSVFTYTHTHTHTHYRSGCGGRRQGPPFGFNRCIIDGPEKASIASLRAFLGTAHELGFAARAYLGIRVCGSYLRRGRAAPKA
jgi:hypothetical protein